MKIKSFIARIVLFLAELNYFVVAAILFLAWLGFSQGIKVLLGYLTIVVVGGFATVIIATIIVGFCNGVGKKMKEWAEKNI